MIPHVCLMPDLTHLNRNRLQGRSILHALSQGDARVMAKGQLYRRNFARLVDKAVYEYLVDREAIVDELAVYERSPEDMAENGSPLHILRYIYHFGNSINEVSRFLKLFDRLKSEPILAELPRVVRRSLEAHSRDLSGVRNAFEHVEDLIFKGEIGDGEAVMLAFSDDGGIAEPTSSAIDVLRDDLDLAKLT